jgi:hypothetical protein
MFRPAVGPTQPSTPLDNAAGARSCHYPHPVLRLRMSGPTPCSPNHRDSFTFTFVYVRCPTRTEQIVGSSPFSPEYRPLTGSLCPFRLMSKSCEPCPFNKVPDFPQTYSSKFLRVQEKGTHVYVCVSPKLRSQTKHEPRRPPPLHASYTRDCQ